MSEADPTRERILEAAGRVFADNGFDSATIREICQLAGANVAAVNYHFGDKHRLYIAAVRRAALASNEQPQPSRPNDASPRQKLRGHIEEFLTRLLRSDRPMWHMQLMMREMSAPDAACRAVVEEHIRPQAAALRAILDELLPEHIPPAERRLIAYSVVGQCLHYKLGAPVIQMLTPAEEHRHYTPDFLAEHITRFTLAAIETLSSEEQSFGRDDAGSAVTTWTSRDYEAGDDS
jgi:AcrR family transcriptional regulator